MDEMIVFEGKTALLNPEVSIKLAEFERVVKEFKAKEEELKQKILEEMESKGIVSIKSPELTISYVAPTTRETFDSKTFRKDHPDLYDEYVSISMVKASVRMKVVSE
jgi:hypothetical protein